MALFMCKPLNKSKIYGAEWAGTSSSAWTRTDGAENFTNPNPAVSNGDGSSPFDDIMPWAGMERVNDETAGVLVKIPKYYYKWTRNGTKMKLQISAEEFEGSHISPAHADRGDGNGERDIVYVSAYHCDSTYKSTSGVRHGHNTKGLCRTNIHNLGSTYWQFDFAMYWTIMMLYLVEFADWNTQEKIGRGCGSYQDNTGLTDSMVYHTGTNKSSRTTQGHTRYRYIEDLWGGTFDWIDGIYFSGSLKNVAYVIKNPANFSDTTGGTNVGTRATSTNFIKSWTSPNVSGFEYALLPSDTISGYGSEYVCDWHNYDQNNNVLIFGGDSNNSVSNGAFRLLDAQPSWSYYACRIQKLP